MSTRSISVDNVLQNASEIPSGQARIPPPRKHSLPKRPNGALVTRLAPQKVPGRSTKLTEKLVLIPDTEEGVDEEDENEARRFTSKYEEEETEPLKDDEWDLLKKRGKVRGKSYAERLSKAKRAEELARVTAYCTAQGYKTKATASFVKNTHGAKTKLYDDCLYTAYHLPLLPGTHGYRVRSSPVLKNPGGKAVLDEEIERSEQRDYHEGYFENTSTYSVRGEDAGHDQGKKDEIHQKEESRFNRNIARPAARVRRQSSPNQMSPVATTFAEMFVFSYGVVVFWNFTERQEKDVLADLTFSDHKTATSLVVRPLEQDDFETEEFHFEYSPFVDRPRVFNDMITLRSGDHMIKLAMSHAVAQSTKLSLFEERMNQTMLNAQHVPKHLALTGQLGMSRSQIFRILGNLFKTRVEVNLCLFSLLTPSNILDVPNFFWESEPTLHPLYFAIREYLEIAPRIKVLNERCKVFLELAEILSNSIADTKMSTITWIIIVLIIISIAVTVTEVALRSMILEKGKPSELSNKNYFASTSLTNRNFSTAQLQSICGEAYLSKTFADDEL
ncbi:Bgt-1829 [Blumeria graminis f. sp. tritici]|uniref:Bgt-1829 n=2 Tax=Blumeria graminis f. sp. tritici TaxID=62690 RepID=A0A9X9MF60_BLUGR|nr:Bgt-1829 [Blumeria graminis f. sp. tritici]